MENQAVAVYFNASTFDVEEWLSVFHCDEFIAVPFAFSEWHIFHPFLIHMKKFRLVIISCGMRS